MVAAPLRLRTFTALILCLGGAGRLHSQISIDVATGDAFNLRTPVTITQKGFPDIHIRDAKFRTRPFKGAPYFDLQVGFWHGNSGWIVGFLHHKLHLEDDLPPEVEQFEISNGFTVLSLSRGWRRGQLILSAGAGVVIANPDTHVRGVDEREDAGFFHSIIGSGYYFSGGSILLAAQRNFPIVKHLHIALAAKASGSYTRVPMPDGHATVPNAALHLHAGLGTSF
jgi:hypothetical protein